MKKLSSLILITLLATACGKGGVSTSARAQDLKATNDATKKAAVEAFMIKDRKFSGQLDEKQKKTLKSFSLKILKTDKFEIEGDLASGRVIQSRGPIDRDLDSTHQRTLTLGTIGDATIYTDSQNPQKYCAHVNIYTSKSKNVLPELHLIACEIE